MNQGTVQNQQNVDQHFTKITESLEQISQNYVQAQSQIEELLKNILMKIRNMILTGGQTGGDTDGYEKPM